MQGLTRATEVCGGGVGVGGRLKYTPGVGLVEEVAAVKAFCELLSSCVTGVAVLLLPPCAAGSLWPCRLL